jgi:hypothetical protein
VFGVVEVVVVVQVADALFDVLPEELKLNHIS